MTKEAKIIIGIAAVAIVGFIIFAMAQPKPIEPTASIDDTLLIREGSHMTGSIDAKVQIVEFGDYECPACAAAHPGVKQLLAEYKDNPNVNFVFRNFPLPMHKNAIASAKAAEAAAAQGKFWEMHNMLYEKQEEWAESGKAIDIFANYATTLGLDVETFKDGVRGNAYSAIIKADQDDGRELGVSGTPTFFINGMQVSPGNVPSYAELKAKVEEALK
jgi:protein-disulfide isomerase